MYKYGEQGMKRKLTIIDENTVKVTEQATILGFIDVGSVTETTYVKDKYQWRDVKTGYTVDIFEEIYFDQEIEAWKFRQTQNVS